LREVQYDPRHRRYKIVPAEAGIVDGGSFEQPCVRQECLAYIRLRKIAFGREWWCFLGKLITPAIPGEPVGPAALIPVHAEVKLIAVLLAGALKM
jgi:hypothetical protein